MRKDIISVNLIAMLRYDLILFPMSTDPQFHYVQYNYYVLVIALIVPYVTHAGRKFTY